MKSTDRKYFIKNPVSVAIAVAFASQLATNLAQAGAGWGDNIDRTGMPIKVQTYYANSPSGLRPDPLTVGNMIDTGKALRKFVNTLPGLTPGGANNQGQYIPLAVAEKWVDGNGNVTNDDYYEIAIVEYTEKMHADLAKATRLRGYVQLETAKTKGKHIALTYPDGSPILDLKGNQVFAVDNPHYLGPTIVATQGTAVRMKYTNYLPVGMAKGAELFLPVDKTLPGAGLGPGADGLMHPFTENRADVHWHGGDTPWISDGTPHQWIAPAGETAAYAVGMGKGVSAQNVPDMPDPGPGSGTLYFPNNLSGRLMFYHDHTSGLTRINVYAGIAAGYVIVDPSELALVTKTLGSDAPGLLDKVGIPLVIQDKTFVPKDIAQQDAKWSTTHWGQEGDLWFPHVYETNQDPNSFDGTNPVGRWDWGPWFWPVFPSQYSLPSGAYGDVTTTPEAFMDTPVINGTAYPTLTVDPKAYRFRILNAGNDRAINLGLYQAVDAKGVICDAKNTMPAPEASGVACTEVKMVPAVPTVNFPPTWPTDGRAGGVPDPATAGPDIVQIGSEGGLLPNPAIIPSQPVSYEQNRRSVTVLNILDHGLLMGGAERADAIIDFSKYAGQTLILYNDAPAPVPAFDPRIDYFTGDGDQTGAGGAGNTLAGFGPNTRTIMQIKVKAARTDGLTGTAFNVASLSTDLPAAYGASQPKPVIPQSAYNLAFGTNDADNLARISTGSLLQNNFTWTPTTATPSQKVTGVTLVGGGTNYMSAPIVNFIGGVDLSPAGLAAGNTPATAIATVDPVTHKVNGVTVTNSGAGYTAAPVITFTPTAVSGSLAGITLVSGGAGYTAPTVVVSGGGGSGATATATVSSSPLTGVTLVKGGTNYTAPAVTITGGSGSGAAAVATVATSPLTGITLVNGGIGYTAPTVSITGGGGSGATASATIDPASGVVASVTLTSAGTGYTTAPTITILDSTGTGASATASVSATAGVLTGLTLTNAGTGYTTAPTITISDSTGTGASATASVAASAGIVTGFTITNAGKGYTTEPAIAIMDITGAGASATTVLSGTSGIGATAMAQTQYTTSLPVQNKAIQELFDPVYGRMNATLGVELPFTSALTQTTIPLNYVDPTTETIKDGETQIWKITHNGVDTHPVHFHMVNLQVINRVGWDGTVKPIKDNEQGWKETIRMNPLEDVYVAVRAKRTTIPFGLPQSSRPMDPSQPLGSALGFTQVDPWTNNPMTVVNAIANFDNEYVWHCHILGHEENDFMRPFVFQPTVVVPNAPSKLLDSGNNGFLTWVDPTPGPTQVNPNTATLGNVKNEIGFKVQRAINNGAFADYANVLANVTSSQVALPPTGTDYAYRVVAYNVAGNSAPSNVQYEGTTPLAPTNLAAPSITMTSVTLTWTDNSSNELSYQVWRNGLMIKTLAANTTSYKDTGVTGNSTYIYQVAAVNGKGSAYSAPLTVSTPVILAPSNLSATVASNASVKLSWTDNATNETGYLVEQSTGGGAFSTLGTVTRNSSQSSATGGTVNYTDGTVTIGNTYTYRVTAINVANGVTSQSSPVTTTITNDIPVAPSNVTAAVGVATGTIVVNWADNSNNESGFTIQRSSSADGVTWSAWGNTTTVGANVTTFTSSGLTAGTWYQYQVRANNAVGSSAYVVSNVAIAP